MAFQTSDDRQPRTVILEKENKKGELYNYNSFLPSVSFQASVQGGETDPSLFMKLKKQKTELGD